jgi:multisubunit Na+/H+ antiporter MnhG subunit
LTRVMETTKQARRFSWALLVLASALAAFSWWRDHPTRAAVSLGVGLLAPLLAYAATPAWLWFFRYWMKFAEVLSWVSTRVILTVFFFLILTPYSALMRLIGKAPLDLTWKDGRKTFWIDRPEPDKKPDLERYRRAY